MRTALARAGRAAARLAVVAGVAMAGVQSAQAEPVTLYMMEGNSSAQVCVASCAGGAVGGTTWIVDGVDYLQHEWFWVRPEISQFANSGTNYPIDALGPYTTTGGGNTPNASVTYTNPFLSARVDYTLNGGDPNSMKSTLTETVTLTNLSNQYLWLNLFQYSDIDLCGTGNTDTLHTNGFESLQSSNCSSVVSHTIVNPSATYVEANWRTPEAPNTLANIAAGHNLNNSTSVGSVNATSAVQWTSYVLPPPQLWPGSGLPGSVATFTITHSLAPVPEPMSMMLLGTGLLGLGRMVRRRRLNSASA